MERILQRIRGLMANLTQGGEARGDQANAASRILFRAMPCSLAMSSWAWYSKQPKPLRLFGLNYPYKEAIVTLS
jgi:hypothetical protein